MAVPDDETRSSVAETIQAAIVHNDELEGSVLVAYVLVAEWMAPDGAKWLSRMSGSPSGDEPSQWQQSGYLHYALFDWREYEDEDGDDD